MAVNPELFCFSHNIFCDREMNCLTCLIVLCVLPQVICSQALEDGGGKMRDRLKGKM